MKKIFLFILLMAGFTGWAQDIPPAPNPPKLVNDFTKETLTAYQTEALENKLKLFDDSTSTNITVVIVKTTGGIDVADYATELGRKWQVGQKGTNNGIVFLIAKEDHKMFIATGYGLEGALPDVTAKQILDDIVRPNFKGDDYYRGIEEGTDAIIQAVKGEYKAPESYGKKKGGTSIGRIIFIIIMIIIFLIVGGGKKGGGSFMSSRGFAAWTIGSMLSGGGGRGGGWSGGGGGGSSGGFGGFGGGSFGGGGASGSW
jgi:uncharacterized protein